MACKRLTRSRPSSTVKLLSVLDIQIHKNIDHFMFTYGLDRDIEDSVGVLLHGWEAGGGVRAHRFLHLL